MNRAEKVGQTSTTESCSLQQSIEICSAHDRHLLRCIVTDNSVFAIVFVVKVSGITVTTYLQQTDI